MDSHNKRINYFNRSRFGRTPLTPNNDLELNDVKNYMWLPIWLTYPEEEDTDVLTWVGGHRVSAAAGAGV